MASKGILYGDHFKLVTQLNVLMHGFSWDNIYIFV